MTTGLSQYAFPGHWRHSHYSALGWFTLYRTSSKWSLHCHLAAL